jgi:hypothetical protein
MGRVTAARPEVFRIVARGTMNKILAPLIGAAMQRRMQLSQGAFSVGEIADEVMAELQRRKVELPRATVESEVLIYFKRVSFPVSDIPVVVAQMVCAELRAEQRRKPSSSAVSWIVGGIADAWQELEWKRPIDALDEAVVQLLVRRTMEKLAEYSEDGWESRIRRLAR